MSLWENLTDDKLHTRHTRGLAACWKDWPNISSSPLSTWNGLKVWKFQKYFPRFFLIYFLPICGLSFIPLFPEFSHDENLATFLLTENIIYVTIAYVSWLLIEIPERAPPGALVVQDIEIIFIGTRHATQYCISARITTVRLIHSQQATPYLAVVAHLKFLSKY